MNRRRHGPQPLSKSIRRVLTDAQDRMTLRIMLGNGGVVAVDGDQALVTVPAGGSRSFPAAMVEEVQRER